MRVERWTPVLPWGSPESPTLLPLATWSPNLADTSDKYDTETLKPATGSMVTVLIPATDPANVTRPVAGAVTSVPTGTE